MSAVTLSGIAGLIPAATLLTTEPAQENANPSPIDTYGPSSGESLSGQYDAIIIGSGITGLMLAAMLSRMGLKVLVLEKAPSIGGRTGVHEVTLDGESYEFPNGMHIFGDMGLTDVVALVKFATRGKLKWDTQNKIDRALVELNDDQSTFETTEIPAGSHREYVKKLSQQFPEEKKIIKEYVRTVRHVSELARLYYLSKSIPSDGRLKGLSERLEKELYPYSSITVEDYLTQLGASKELKRELTCEWDLFGVPPQKLSFAVHALVMDHYMNNGTTPLGGPDEFGRTTQAVIEKADGKLVTRAEVSELVLNDAQDTVLGVKLNDGKTIFAKDGGTIINASTLPALRGFLPENLQNRLSEDKILPNTPPYFVLNLVLNVPPKDFGGFKHVLPQGNDLQNLETYLSTPFNPNNPLPSPNLSIVPVDSDAKSQQRHPDKTAAQVFGVLPKGVRGNPVLEAAFEAYLIAELDKLYPDLHISSDNKVAYKYLFTSDQSMYDGVQTTLRFTDEKVEQIYSPYVLGLKHFFNASGIATHGVGGGIMAASAIMFAMYPAGFPTKMFLSNPIGVLGMVFDMSSGSIFGQ